MDVDVYVCVNAYAYVSAYVCVHVCVCVCVCVYVDVCVIFALSLQVTGCAHPPPHSLLPPPSRPHPLPVVQLVYRRPGVPSPIMGEEGNVLATLNCNVVGRAALVSRPARQPPAGTSLHVDDNITSRAVFVAGTEEPVSAPSSASVPIPFPGFPLPWLSSSLCPPPPPS